MYVIDFKKERQQEILSAIENGTAIPAPRGAGWTRYEMLQVAGAMYAAIFPQGPANVAAASVGDPEKYKEYVDSLHDEHREATEETLTQDVHDAIEFCGQLSFMVMDDAYDEYNEPHIQVIGSGKEIRIVKGGKQQ